jgi:hypothetical protein
MNMSGSVGGSKVCDVKCRPDVIIHKYITCKGCGSDWNMDRTHVLCRKSVQKDVTVWPEA